MRIATGGPYWGAHVRPARYVKSVSQAEVSVFHKGYAPLDATHGASCVLMKTVVSQYTVAANTLAAATTTARRAFGFFGR